MATKTRSRTAPKRAPLAERCAALVHIWRSKSSNSWEYKDACDDCASELAAEPEIARALVAKPKAEGER